MASGDGLGTLVSGRSQRGPRPPVHLEIHQLDQRYSALRIASRSRQQRLVVSLLEHGQQAPVTVVPHAERAER